MTTLQLLNPPHILDAANGPELDDALKKLGAFLAQENLTRILAIELRQGELEADEVARTSEQLYHSHIFYLTNI